MTGTPLIYKTIGGTQLTPNFTVWRQLGSIHDVGDSFKMLMVESFNHVSHQHPKLVTNSKIRHQHRCGPISFKNEILDFWDQNFVRKYDLPIDTRAGTDFASRNMERPPRITIIIPGK